MKFYVADKKTGTFIEEVESIGEGLSLIEEYEKEDMKEGIYKPDFYDIVNENHCSIDLLPIKFKSINIDGKEKDWEFDSRSELESGWNCPFVDLPANDDPVFHIELDGKEVWLGGKPEKGECDSDVSVWFEDILTYLGIDIWG